MHLRRGRQRRPTFENRRREFTVLPIERLVPQAGAVISLGAKSPPRADPFPSDCDEIAYRRSSSYSYSAVAVPTDVVVQNRFISIPYFLSA